MTGNVSSGRVRRLGALDLGTNAFRMKAVETVPGGTMKPLRFDRVFTRLGEGIIHTGRIGEEPLRRALEAVRGFRGQLEQLGVDRYRAVGTSVFRRAANRDEVLERFRREAGVGIELIDGDTEAQLATAGVLLRLHHPPGWQVVFDVGGGSTEFILVRDGEIADHMSLDTGVVVLTETFLKSDPPTDAECRALAARVAADLEPLSRFRRHLPDRTVPGICGTAGTVTSLAALDLEQRSFDPDRINNHPISFGRAHELLERLRHLPVHRRVELPGLLKGREDLIIAGSYIVLEVMRRFGADRIVASDGGLLDGVLLKLAAGS